MRGAPEWLAAAAVDHGGKTRVRISVSSFQTDATRMQNLHAVKITDGIPHSTNYVNSTELSVFSDKVIGSGQLL